MSKTEKLLRRICARPTPANITWGELTALLRSLGFEMLKGSGSRRKFHHPPSNTLLILHEPHPQSEVARVYVEQVVGTLESKGLIPRDDT
jgi:predicted RNA binding protein YcfA (HicA-like mRNA interferase family)